jgi:hypothetical protein
MCRPGSTGVGRVHDVLSRRSGLHDARLARARGAAAEEHHGRNPKERERLQFRIAS